MVSVILQFPSFFSWMTPPRLWSAGSQPDALGVATRLAAETRAKEQWKRLADELGKRSSGRSH
jgi:hypothetical protein